MDRICSRVLFPRFEQRRGQNVPAGHSTECFCRLLMGRLQNTHYSTPKQQPFAVAEWQRASLYFIFYLRFLLSNLMNRCDLDSDALKRKLA